MKKLIYLTIVLLIFTSCNQDEIKRLHFENTILINKVDQLENQLKYGLIEYQEKIDELEFELSERVLELNGCKVNYEGYRYGNMCSTTRFVRGRGQVTVYGAENVIDFLSDHYTP